jgi:hypothetical protein
VIDRRFLGHASPPCTLDVERGRLRQFAHAIGETRAVYVDETAARAAGYPDLPVPPTFLFCLEMDRPNPYGWFDEVGIPGSRTFTIRKAARSSSSCRITGSRISTARWSPSSVALS